MYGKNKARITANDLIDLVSYGILSTLEPQFEKPAEKKSDTALVISLVWYTTIIFRTVGKL